MENEQNLAENILEQQQQQQQRQQRQEQEHHREVGDRFNFIEFRAENARRFRNSQI